MLETMDPSRLATMLTAHGADHWRPEEMGSILRHQLSAQLEFDLSGIASGDHDRDPPPAPEAARKRAATFGELLLDHPQPPVAMLRRLGFFYALRYRCGWLRLDSALRRLGKLSGAQIRVVTLRDGQAAVDVDQMADLELVRKLIREGGR